jgi:arylsulfatase A-like enzyme
VAVLLTFFALLLGCSEGSNREKSDNPTNRSPNFVIIFTDDQGYADVGVFGATDIKTPNLDRMAQEGIRLTDFYVAGPVCTPSRAGLLTGCYPKRVGLHVGVLWPDSPTGLNPEELTIAEVLRARGYATACIGKWHLGRPATFLPTRQGFDTFLGIPYSNDMIPEHILSILGGNFPPLPLLRNEEVIETGTDQNSLTRRYTEEALRFIKENRKGPFFLYLAHSMPHYPCHASEEFRDERVTEAHRGIYASAVQEIDWSVRQILDILKELDLDDRTLVIFTSDNGPWLLARMLFREPTGNARPLRGWKGETFEGGVRVPAIMRWPGRLPEGAVCSELVSTLDLLPTIARYAGAELPVGSEHRIDGKDIAAVLEIPEGISPHEYFYYYDSDTGELEAVRDKEGWKLHMRRHRTPVAELYYLPDDIGESDNVFLLNPDVVDRLERAANEFDEEVTANARPVGQVGQRNASRAASWLGRSQRP